MSKTEKKEKTNKKEKTPRKRSKVLKFFLRLFFLVFVSLALGTAYLYFYFPKEKTKKLILSQLQERYEITLKFKGIGFNPFTGLELSGVSLKGPQETEIPMMKLDRILFKVEFRDLIRGRITIKKALIKKPFIYLERKGAKWNFEALLDKFGKGKKAPAKKSTTGFVMPVEVNIEEFYIDGLSVSCLDEKKLEASIENVDMKLSVKAGKSSYTAKLELSSEPSPADSKNLSLFLSKPKEIRLNSGFYLNISLKTTDTNEFHITGKWGLSGGTMEFGGKKDTLQVSSSLDAIVDLYGNLRLNSFNISSENIIWLKVKGHAKNAFKEADFTLNVEGASVLESAFRKFKEITPLDQAAGSLLLSDVQLKGHLGKKQTFEFRGKIKGSDLSIASKKIGFNISESNFSVDILSGRFNDRLEEINAYFEENTAKFTGVKHGGANKDLIIKNIKQSGSVKVKDGNNANITYKLLVNSAKIGARESVNNVSVSLSSKCSGASLDVEKIEKLSGSLKVSLDNANVLGVSTEDLSNEVFFDLSGEQLKELRVKLDLGNITYNDLKLGKISLPVSMSSSISAGIDKRFVGNKKIFSIKNIPSVTGEVNLGDGAVEIRLDGSTKALFDDDVSLKISVDSELEKLIRLVPEEFVKRIEKLKGHVTSTTTIKGKLNKGIANSPLNIDEDLQITGLLVNLADDKVSLSPSDIYIHINSRYKLFSQKAQIKAGGDISLGSARIKKLVELTSLQTSFQASTKGENFSSNSTRINGNIIGLKALIPNFSTNKVNLTFAVKSEQNTGTGDIAVKKLKLMIPSVLDFNGTCSAKKWGEYFGSDFKLSIASFEDLYDILTKSTKEKLPVFAPKGRGEFYFKAAGKKPSLEDIKTMILPIVVDGSINLAQTSIGLREGNIRLDGIDGNVNVSYHPHMDSFLESNLNIKSIYGDSIKQFGKMPFSLHCGVQASPRFKEITFPPSSIRLGERFIKLKYNGKFSDLLSSIGKKPSLVGLARVLKARFNASLGVNLNSELKLFKPVILGGLLNIDLNSEYDGKKGAKLKITTEADKFNASKEGLFKISSLRTNIPIEKNITFISKDSKSTHVEKNSHITSSPIFEQLREYSETKNSIFLKEMLFKSFAFKDIFFDFYFKDERLNIEKFGMGFLGGSIGGKVDINKPNDGIHSDINFEFSNLNLNKLIENRIEGDSEVSGIIKLGIKDAGLVPEEVIDISQIKLEILIAHIGENALERLLLFIDPTESNPAIVSVKSYLEYASPSNVKIHLNNGALSVTVKMKAKAIFGKEFTFEVLRRAPVTQLKNFRIVKENLEKINPIIDILKIILSKELVLP